MIETNHDMNQVNRRAMEKIIEYCRRWNMNIPAVDFTKTEVVNDVATIYPLADAEDAESVSAVAKYMIPDDEIIIGVIPETDFGLMTSDNISQAVINQDARHLLLEAIKQNLIKYPIFSVDPDTLEIVYEHSGLTLVPCGGTSFRLKGTDITIKLDIE